MKKMTFILAWVLMSCLAWADVIVLRSGKQMIIPGSFAIKGAYVVFKDDQGQLVQLPLKIVDVEKSKKVTAAYVAELEAATKRRLAKPKPEKESMSMGEIAEIIDAKRPKDQPPPRVVLGNDRLEKFAVEQPLPQNDAMPLPEYEPLSTPASIKEARAKFHESYTKLNSDLQRLDATLESSVQFADALANESAFGDDPTGSVFEAMDKADKAVEDLRVQKKKKEEELKQLENNARKARIRNYKNQPRGRNN